jgi:hypothetical protein
MILHSSWRTNAALTGAKSYLDSIETEQFEMKPVDDGPGASEEDMKDATAELFCLLKDRLFNVEEGEEHKELERIVAGLMPRIIEHFRTYDPEQFGPGWIDRDDIVESMVGWSYMDPQEIDDLQEFYFEPLLIH